MIIGNGLIANAIKECDKVDVLFIAAGVSNSVDPKPEDFKREEKLVLKLLKEDYKRYFYFSTVSLADESMTSKPYIQHKLKMEELIQQSGRSYVIIRLPNMLSIQGNPNTLVPYFYKCLLEDQKVKIQKNAHRYLLSKLQLKEMVSQLLEADVTSQIINGVRKEPISAMEIYLSMAAALAVEPNFELIEGGADYKVQQNFSFENLPNEGIELIVKRQLAHSIV